MLNDQLLHIWVLRRSNHVGMRTPECRSERLKEYHLGVDILLLRFSKTVPPSLERISVFDLPFHIRNITPMEYLCQVIFGIFPRLPIFRVAESRSKSPQRRNLSKAPVR